MEIGFVNLNQDALNKANKLMKLLQGQGAIDELGLGRIRDAFSNSMFPGMSTLQTRAKYFLLLPALYSFLEKGKIQDARDARAKIRDYEISLTRRLIDGTPKEISWGIIGADSLQNRDGYVKYDPAYVYQAGMETYGLVKSGGNVYRMIAERSIYYQNLPHKHKGNEETDDADDLTGLTQLFLTCGENYDFQSKKPLSISLTYKEAEFLKHQIVSHTQGSLMGYLLDSGLYISAIQCDFEALEMDLQGKIPEELFKTYVIALRFSRFAYLLRLRYAMLFDIAVGAENAKQKETEFFDYFKTHALNFTPDSIEEIIQSISPRVSEDTCKIFCRKASRLLNARDWGALDDLIMKREVETKTLKRSKLKNAGEHEPGKPFEVPAPMSFRWNTIVRNVLKEIKEGLGE